LGEELFRDGHLAGHEYRIADRIEHQGAGGRFNLSFVGVELGCDQSGGKGGFERGLNGKLLVLIALEFWSVVVTVLGMDSLVRAVSTASVTL